MTVEIIGANSLPPDLNATLPLPGDIKKEGDDHIRNLKLVMQKFYADYLTLTGNHGGRIAAVEAFVAANNTSNLGGQPASFYLNAGNITAGVLPAGRLSGTYGINISGNSATATLAVDATHAADSDTATMADDSLKLGGLTLVQLYETLPQRVSWSSVAVTNFSGSFAKVATITLAAALAQAKLFVGRLKGTVSLAQLIGDQTNFSAYIQAVPSNTIIGFLDFPDYAWADAGAAVAAQSAAAPHGMGSLGTNNTTSSFKAKHVYSADNADSLWYVATGAGQTMMMTICEMVPSGTTGFEVYMKGGGAATATNSASNISLEGMMQ